MNEHSTSHETGGDAPGQSRPQGRRRRRPVARIAMALGLLLAGAGTVWSQAGGEALVIDALGRVGIGVTVPRAPLDLQQEPRTSNVGTHPSSVAVMYATGALGEASGIEFRHTNGSQGIGFGYNTVYATGSNDNQDLNLKPRGTGKVVVQGPLEGPGAVPVGAILMWSGDPAKLPPGWVLCDGANKTPDLRSRFVVGYDSRAPDYDTAGKTGGEERVTLKPAEVGNHRHGISAAGGATGTHDHRWAGSSTTNANANVTVYAGVTQYAEQNTPAAPHENRPPYLVLAYIMYTGAVR